MQGEQIEWGEGLDVRTPAMDGLLRRAAERSRWSGLGRSRREKKGDQLRRQAGDRVPQTWVGPGEAEPGVKNDSEVVWLNHPAWL